MELKTILRRTRETRPLVHSITNYVTVNDCANLLLAAGAAPIMADAEEEAAEFAAKADALCVNIGTLDRFKLAAMFKASEAAAHAGRPAVLDPVGAGATAYRTNAALGLLSSGAFTLVRGNLSEIRALAGKTGETRGTDAAFSPDGPEQLESAISTAQNLARNTKTLIGVSGAVDILASPDRVALVRSGDPIMTSISGTGCMLSVLTAAFLGANRDDPFDAALAAFAVMGVCGEIALEQLKPGEGPQRWRLLFLDAVALLSPDELERRAKIEIR